jgi:ABC-2 type transport system ATP-binding protein
VYLCWWLCFPLAEEPWLREQYGETTYHVYTTVEVPESVQENGRFRTVVESMDAVEGLRETAQDAGGRVVDIRTEESSLEEVFLNVADPDRRPSAEA